MKTSQVSDVLSDLFVIYYKAVSSASYLPVCWCRCHGNASVLTLGGWNEIADGGMHVGARPTETHYHFSLSPRSSDCLNSADADGGGSPGEPLRSLNSIIRKQTRPACAAACWTDFCYCGKQNSSSEHFHIHFHIVWFDMKIVFQGIWVNVCLMLIRCRDNSIKVLSFKTSNTISMFENVIM